jgi:hypothetical protein
MLPFRYHLKILLLETNNKQPNRIAKMVRVLVTGLFVMTLSYLFLFPQLFYCQIIPFSEFIRVQEHVFVSPEIPPIQYKSIQKLIKSSETRIDSFYGGKKSRPFIIICTTGSQYQRYCSSNDGAGCSVGTPWGKSYVVLNLQGINTDVISHEMSHVELLERLGWWKTTFQVPQWFNEGVALMVDRRFVNNSDPVERYAEYTDEWLYYTGGGQIIRELHQISDMKTFFSGNQKQVMLAYMTSGMEISYWLASMRDDGFRYFLNLISSGYSFRDAYSEAGTRSRSASYRELPLNPLRLDRFQKVDK